MKTILIIDDGTSAVTVATKLAMHIAGMIQAELTIAQTFHKSKASTPKVLAGNYHFDTGNDYIGTQNLRKEIKTVQMPGANPADLAKLALQMDCWLVIKGCSEIGAGYKAPDMQSLLNQLRCPLLLVPERWAGHQIHRITYIADLRYCRLNIMRYLTTMAKSLHAGLSLAHISAKDLPPIDEKYSRELFAEIAYNSQSCFATFNNIREVDIHRAVDIIINHLHNDLIVLINHRFHFREIIGDRLTDRLPKQINIPVLLFPI
ncbi:hypothetical protein GCM10027049_22250 [Mucilaginibacter puniceus]